MHKTLKVKFKNGEFSPVIPINGIEEGENGRGNSQKRYQRFEICWYVERQR